MNILKRKIVRNLICLIHHYSWFHEFRQSNRESQLSESLLGQLWAFRKGFYLETIKLCGITKSNFNEYLSDKAYLNLHPINCDYSKIIDNKFYLPFLLKDYPELVPRYYYLVDKGRLVKIDKSLADDMGLVQLCKEMHSLALKPCSCTLGEGFYHLKWDNDKFLLNGKTIEIGELISFVESLDRYLVTEYVAQHKYSADINPDSVNTIRVFCVRDLEDQAFFIPVSFHRFGVEGKYVDNIGCEDRGLGAFIDVETGRIKNISIIKEKGKFEKVIGAINHPDSNQQISGIVIPNWTEMKDKVLAVMNHLSFLKYGGLDIVITESGFKIIEINSLPTLFVLQVENGALKKGPLKRFFLHK